MRKVLPERGLGREEILQKLKDYSAGGYEAVSP